MTPRLPGFGPIPRRRLRNERALDGIAQLLRDLEQYGPVEQAIVTLARTTGAALDRLEHNEDRSEHTVGAVARVHLQALEALRPTLTTGDGFDELLEQLRATVRDTSPA